MKKINFALIYTMAFMLCLSNIAGAQKFDVALNYPFFSPFEKMGFKGNNANDFNIKAVRDFVKTFKTVDNNRWSLAEDGSAASTFTSDGIKTRVAYDRKGYRRYILKVYKENKLSDDIRHMVKREYYDATITLIKELETNDGLVIYVHMQDKGTWKIVSIADGEMKLVENFNKG